MIYARAFYFIFFAAASCLLPFLTLYYQELGLSGSQIGLLVGLIPLVSMISASVWGAVADATGKHHFLLIIAIIGVWISVAFMITGPAFAWLMALVIGYAFFSSPIIVLVDNSVMEMLGAEKSEYGKQRVWGSYGWGITAAIVGLVIQQTGLAWAFYGYLILMLAALLVAIKLPVKQASLGEKFWHGLRTLLNNQSWLLFLAVALVAGISLNIYLNYLFLHLEDLGISRTIMGLSLTMATISEIPIFLYSRHLLKRWGPLILMAFALAAMAVRGFAYAEITLGWQVLLISLLHGLTFATMWAAGVAYAAESAPPGLGATAQGVFGSAVFGLGAMLGAFLGGYMYDIYGAVTLFRFTGWLSLMALAVFVLANRRVFSQQMGLT